MENYAVKRRTLSDYSGKVYVGYTVNGNPSTPTNVTYSVVGDEVTYSRSNKALFMKRRLLNQLRSRDGLRMTDRDFRRLIKLLQDWDIGSAFYNSKRVGTVESPIVRTNDTTIYQTSAVRVGMTVDSPLFAKDNLIPRTSLLWPTAPGQTSEFNRLFALGATAISRTAPTVPKFSLPTALGELKNDGLPSLIGSITWRVQKSPLRLVDSSAKEYLNVEFGWKPFVSDILSVCRVVSESEKILQDYEARSGRRIGRTYEFPEDSSTTVSYDSGVIPYPALDTRAYIGPYTATRTVTTVKTVKSWFEGVYSYSLPLASDARSKVALYAKEANHLLGIKLTPDVLWNLQPWSWFSDWFVNIGDILTNLSAFSTDHLLLKRGYIMSTTSTRVTYTHPGVTIKGWGPTGTLSQTLEALTKVRQRATPWGFGVTFSGFSPRQIALMAALGITLSQ